MQYEHEQRRGEGGEFVENASDVWLCMSPPHLVIRGRSVVIYCWMGQKMLLQVEKKMVLNDLIVFSINS